MSRVTARLCRLQLETQGKPDPFPGKRPRVWTGLAWRRREGGNSEGHKLRQTDPFDILARLSKRRSSVGATGDMLNRLRTLERRIDQLGRAIGLESDLMVRSIGWNVLASVLQIIAYTYRKDSAKARPSLETLFAGFTRAVLEDKQVRGCSRCAGPMVEAD